MTQQRTEQAEKQAVVEEAPAAPGNLMEIPVSADVTTMANSKWDPQQWEAVRSMVLSKNSTVSPGEFAAFMELAARYKLDPFAKHIWLAPMKGGNTILIGRDGLQHIAQMSGDLVRLESGVVYDGDDYLAFRGENGWEVRHNSTGGSGAPRGAWAIAERRGQAPYFFWAPYEEYLPKDPSKSAWGTFKTAMIGKVAQANALRLAFNVSGVVAADEVGAEYGNAGVLTDDSGSFFSQRSGGGQGLAETDMNWPQDEGIRARLHQLIASARAARRGAMAPAQLRLRLQACATDADYVKLGEELIAWHKAQNVPVPPKPEPVVDGSAEEVG